MQNAERWKFIYDQINGTNESDVCEWVKDETSEGGELAPLIGQIYEARNRLCEKTGLNPDTDSDIELLVSGFENFARACGKLMYHYGYMDGTHKI
ncbi:MAG: hypothetical protein K2O11_08025 [Oscillospiraceae bacterium]|nr:hypothetical protein [Oscillospiraceae bacterium]